MLSATAGLNRCRLVRSLVLLPLFGRMAMGQAAPTKSAGPLRTAASKSAPDTLATMLARAGYVAIPLQHAGLRPYIYVTATIDTISLGLMLDAGCDCIMLLLPNLQKHLTIQPSMDPPPSDQRVQEWAVTTGIRIGPLPMEATDTRFNDVNGRIAKWFPEGRGLLGVHWLLRHHAVIDYATDSLYVLPAALDSAPASAQPAPAPTLRAALEAAGHYRTFLELARTAGLTALLDGAAGQPLSADSLLWTYPGVRTQAMLWGFDSAGVSKATIRRALSQRFRRPGQLTAFVPTDAAFAQLPARQLAALQADSAQAAQLVRGHVLTGAALALETLRRAIGGVAQPGGPAYGFYVRGGVTEVDRLRDLDNDGRVLARARIVQPDLTAGNGVAHGIDRLLVAVPGSDPIATVLAEQGYTPLALRKLLSGRYSIPIRVRYSVGKWVDSLAERLLVDTGAGCDGNKDLTVTDPAIVEGDSLAGSLTVDTVAVGHVVFTGERLKGDGVDPDGLVCAPFLVRHRARIDFTTGMLYLRLP